jgi:hypothetical protein
MAETNQIPIDFEKVERELQSDYTIEYIECNTTRRCRSSKGVMQLVRISGERNAKFVEAIDITLNERL